MRIIWKGGALGAMLALAGCAAFGIGETQRRTTALQDDMFIATALAHAQSEIELAQMAERKAHTRTLVAYARRIADGRTGLRDELTAAATASGTEADNSHAPNADLFKSLEGETFERAYVAAQIEDQQNNLDFFEFEAQYSRDSGLKDLAAAAVPQLRQDLADATNIVKDLPFEEQTAVPPEAVVNPRRR